MKKIFIISAFLAIACSSENTQDNIVRDNAEKMLFDKMDDPESYEFVSLEKIDSSIYLDNFNKEYDGIKRSLNENNEKIKLQEKWGKSNSSMFSKSKMQFYKGQVGIYKERINRLDSIKSLKSDSINTVYSYMYLLKCRGNNKMGAKVLQELIVQTDNNLNVVNIAASQNEIINVSDKFPGYNEYIK